MHRHRLRRAAAALALALGGGLWASPAAAQFGTAYDPDFAPEPAAAVSTATAAASTETVTVQILIPNAPKAPVFQLIPRADPDRILEPETSTAAATAAAPAPEAGMTLDRYVKIRDAVDRGEKPGVGGIENPEDETITQTGAVAVSTAAPKPPPPEIELPTYGTSLSVTGRKLIGFNYSEKEYTHDQTTTGRPKTTDLIAITQQLQLRMQGKVGPKITVNVDYDDSRPNQQDISVVYQGDPNETVQNVSFGDINLSLPSTEFVSYNKQLFGIRADIKYKGLHFTVIGSRTKGTTKSKQFHGNQQFVAEDILDTSYIRRTYYDLSFGNPARLPIRSGTEHIYLATQALGVTNSNQSVVTVDDLNVHSSSFTGYFQLLAAGNDYTVNYAKGYIQLRTAAQPQYVIAVDYIDATGNEVRFETSAGSTTVGGDGLYKLVKTPSDIPISSNTVLASEEIGYNREQLTFYPLGQQSITPDNGQGNFILELLNASRQPVGSTLNPLQIYPATINVDFTNGVFNLLQPFSVSNSSPSTPDPNIYSPAPINERLFHVEFNYRFKTFTLEPNLVTASEIVVLDGGKLTRNVDYFIDYTGGFLTFFNPQRINTNSEIDITYEVQAFAGASNDTLLGGRASYDITDNISVGSTILYDAGAKPTITPQITELAKSTLVYDFDVQVKKMKIGDHLNMSLSAEFAQSKTDPNLNSYAIIDNMESILQQIPANTAYTSWQIASNPSGVISDPTLVTWYNESIPTLQINPNAQATSAASTNVLDLQYSFNSSENDETSIVIPLSNTGIDMSLSSTLQVVMLGDNSNNLLNFHLGSINEDVDGTGGMTLYCANGQVRYSAPKTEDLACTNILQPGEDVGWCYSYPPGAFANPCAMRYGAGNGKIDTEDLNANQLLDPADLSGGDFGYANTQNQGLYDATTASTFTEINFGPTAPNSGWQTLQIPLNISSQTASSWTTIKQLRISVHQNGMNTCNGGPCILKFASIAVLGNSWLNGLAGDPDLGTGAIAFESMTVTAVNNINNPNYLPIYNAGGDAGTVFNELYGSVASLQQQTNTQNIQEQALQLDYSGLTPGCTVYTKRVFSTAIDISQHHEFNFLLYGNADQTHVDTSGKQVFFMRVGSDQSYFEVQVPITFQGWKLIHVHQTDPGNGIMDNWVSDEGAFTTVVSSNGPTLQNVGELVAGIYGRAGVGTSPSLAQGRVYVDEIFLAAPASRTGNAEKLQADFEVPGWSTFGFKYRSVDQNFQTPTSVVSNQGVATTNFYLNLIHYSWLPMTFNVTKTVTNTPATVDTGNLSNLVSLLQEGTVTTLTEAGRVNVAYGAYPRLNLSYTRTLTDYDLLARQDDRSVYAATMQYGFPVQKPWVPKTLDLSYSFTDYDVLYQSDFSRAQQGDYDATEHDFSYSTRMTFVPWKGSSFNPSWSMTEGDERRTDYTSGSPVDSEYPKSFQQDAGFASNWKINNWLNPQLNYTMETIASTQLSVSTYVVNNTTYTYNPGDLKNVTRTANGSFSIPINFGDVFPKSAALKSLSVVSGYQLQDGDSWTGINQSENLADLFTVRQPLRPSANDQAAQLVSLTQRDTFNSTQRWTPFQYYNLVGREATWKTLSLSNNFVETIQHSNVTGTGSETITQTPVDTVISLSKLEQLWHTQAWMSNAQMDFKYSLRTTDNVGATFDTQNSAGTDLRMLIYKKYDIAFSYNFRTDVNKDLVVDANTADTIHQDADAQVTFDYKKFRFTPKLDYTFDQTSTGGVKTVETTVITPSLLTRADLSLPAGLRLPGSSRPLLFTNRIIWTTTLSLADTQDPVVQENNSILASLTTSADYELAKNLRMTINGTLQRLWHQYLLQENYISYSLGTNLTFQF